MEEEFDDFPWGVLCNKLLAFLKGYSHTHYMIKREVLWLKFAYYCLQKHLVAVCNNIIDAKNSFILNFTQYEYTICKN